MLVTLVCALQDDITQPALVQVGCWSIGEFGDLLINATVDEVPVQVSLHAPRSVPWLQRSMLHGCNDRQANMRCSTCCRPCLSLPLRTRCDFACMQFLNFSIFPSFLSYLCPFLSFFLCFFLSFFPFSLFDSFLSTPFANTMYEPIMCALVAHAQLCLYCCHEAQHTIQLSLLRPHPHHGIASVCCMEMDFDYSFVIVFACCSPSLHPLTCVHTACRSATMAPHTNSSFSSARTSTPPFSTVSRTCGVYSNRST
jgi:hypothetical protein